MIARTISFGLGRPISISDDDINIPYPEDQPFFLELVSLARIYSRAARQLYGGGSKQRSLGSLWTVARGLKAELDAFRTALPPELRLGPGAPPPPGAYPVLRLFLNNRFYHALILIFRPFLILHTQWQKDHRLSASGPDGRVVEVLSRQLRDRVPWLFEACFYCVQAARELLVCLAGAIENNDLVRRLAYNCFYVEGGSFVLILNMLRDASSMAQDAACVRVALRAMDTMHSTAPRNISAFAIRHMLELVEGGSSTADHPLNEQQQQQQGEEEEQEQEQQEEEQEQQKQEQEQEQEQEQQQQQQQQQSSSRSALVCPLIAPPPLLVVGRRNG